MIDCFATGDYMKVLVLDIKIFFANMDMLEAFEAYRDENGAFTSREELKKVPKLGA